MRPIFRLLVGLLLTLPLAPLHAAVQGKDVTYSAGGTVLKGYLAYDDAVQGKRPGVLVIHEWWGQDGYARDRARALAKLGYAAFAADMYGNGMTVDHPDKARAAMKELLGDANTRQQMPDTSPRLDTAWAEGRCWKWRGTVSKLPASWTSMAASTPTTRPNREW